MSEKIKITSSVPSESYEQETLFKWMELQMKKRPELKLCFHIANGGSRGKAEAARFKAEGVKAGVPDLFLPVSRGPYHGLFIEMKRRSGGRTSEAQRKWIAALAAQGYLATICYGWKEAAELIEDYLDERGV